MEYDLKCVAKIHDIGFRVDAKLEIRGSKEADTELCCCHKGKCLSGVGVKILVST